MANSKTRVPVHRTKVKDYESVAESFYRGPKLAREFEYWKTSGVLIVHAAIALADAIAIKLAGVKSRGKDHHETYRKVGTKKLSFCKQELDRFIASRRVADDRELEERAATLANKLQMKRSYART